MRSRTGATKSRSALALWAAAAVLTAGGTILTAMAWSDLKPADAYPALANVVAVLAYATLGVLIIRRVGNRIGWLLLGEAVALGLVWVTSGYAVVGVVTHPGALPAAKFVGVISEIVFIPTAMAIIYMLLVFPTGALPSSRWRYVERGLIAVTALSVLGFILSPRQAALPAPGGVSLTYPNPFAISSLPPASSTLMLGTSASLTTASVIFFAASAVALVVRYRSGGRVLRQQIKWLAYVTLAWVFFQAALAGAQAVAGYDSSIALVAGVASGLTALILIPAAITLAILRYRLYDIDLIINRTLVYAALTAILVGTYMGVVTVAGVIVGGSEIVTAAATLSVAALFQPLRRRIQDFIDRRFYRRKYDAARIVDAFSSRLRHEVDLEAMRVDLLAAVRDTMQPRRISVWLRH